MSEYGGLVKELLMDKEFLFGFDFYFDGRARLKLYPTFERDTLSNGQVQDKLKDIFGFSIFQLIKKSSKFYVSFNEKGEKILHFQPTNKKEFIRWLGSEVIDSIDGVYSSEGYDINVVSFLEKELVSNNLKNINLYY